MKRHLLTVLLLLSACGGGSGGDTTETSSTTSVAEQVSTAPDTEVTPEQSQQKQEISTTTTTVAQNAPVTEINSITPYDSGSQIQGVNRPDPQYDYAPDVLKVGGDYAMYWCGRNDDFGGDTIMRSVSSDMRSWSSPSVVFTRSELPGSFDEHGVCDPYVVKFEGTYYLYYNGLQLNNPDLTAIGLATSTNGKDFQRHSQDAILLADERNESYGAHIASVVLLDRTYHAFMFDNSTGEDKNYVLESNSPFFESYDRYWHRGGAPAPTLWHEDSETWLSLIAYKQSYLTVHTFNPNYELEKIFDVQGFWWSEGFGAAHDEHGHLTGDLVWVAYAGGSNAPWGFDLEKGRITLSE